MAQVIEIGMDDHKPKNLNVMMGEDRGTIKLSGLPSPSPGTSKKVNFGPGAEMLMNPHRKSNPGSPKSNLGLSELNSISLDNVTPARRTSAPTRSSLFASAKQEGKPIVLNLSSMEKPTKPPQFASVSGTATTAGKDAGKTWDGYQKFNNIPIDPTKDAPKEPKMSKEKELVEKLTYLRKLEQLEKRGVTLTKKYTMDSALSEMKGEYEMIKQEKEKKNSVKFQGKMLMACVSGLEFLNNKFDPLDMKLDGWSESINENVDEYDDIFGELHEKYGDKAKMAPELKLLFMLGGSAVMIHMTNTMFKSSMPGMDDIMRQNPELMQQFTQAAVNTMGKENPGMGGFMQNMMGGQPPMQQPPQYQQQPPMGSPQGPSDNMRRMPPQMQQRQQSTRPDIGMSRGSPIFNDAENMESSFGSAKDKRSKTKRGNARPEMRGPNDIGDILAGLKTKKINLATKSNSVVSIDEIKELNGSNLNVPKSKRKQKSERNVVSLNL
jgi:hypothetical protein